MAQFERHYTLDEAQATIPWLRSLFAKIHRLVRMIQDEKVKPLHPAKSPLMEWDQHMLEASDEDRRKLIEGLLKAVVEKGIVVQDIHRGLLDFPAWREGREVLLCYELSDGDQIQYWHDLESGFAGRQEIEAEDFGN